MWQILSWKFCWVNYTSCCKHWKLDRLFTVIYYSQEVLSSNLIQMGFLGWEGVGLIEKVSILKHTRVFYSLVLNMKGLYLLLLQYFLHVPDLITLSNETCNQNRNFKLERYKNITVNWRDIIVAVIYQHILRQYNLLH